MTNHHKKIVPKICELEKCYETIPLRYNNGKAKQSDRYAASRYCCPNHAAIGRSIAQQTPVPMTSAANLMSFVHDFKKNWWMGNPMDTFNMRSTNEQPR